LFGLVAVRRASLGLFVVSGIAFAAAFNTKLYAIFALIPIIAVFLLHRPKKIKNLLFWLLVFSVPVLISSYLWYETFVGIGLVSIFRHADLLTQNPSPAPPTYFFATNFLVSYGLGWLFIDAVVLSLFFGVVFRKLFPRFFTFDVVSLFVIVSVIGVNTFLGAALDLKSPFLNAFKYDYQALPFFCFIGASLISKSLKILELTKGKTKLAKGGLVALGFIGLFLLATAIYYNIDRTLLFSKWAYFIFRVEPSVDSGYSLFNSTQVTPNSSFVIVQMIGLTAALSGVIWISRHRLAAIFNPYRKSGK